MMCDRNGVSHEVRVTPEFHDYWTAAGELRADCVCGWWDHYPYTPDGQGFAELKLQYRAADHVPADNSGSLHDG